MENEAQAIILPRTEDLLLWLAWLVPVIFLLLWDVWKAWKRRAPWIPGQALVLSPFIIRLLSYIDYSHISVYSGSRYQTVKVEAILVKNQKVIDSGRVMMCVLIAYLIPGMARSSSITDWSNLAALALSITFHVVNEFRSDWKVEKRNESLSALAPSSEGLDRINSYLNHYIFAIIIISAIIYLLLLLIHAVVTGRTIRMFISKKVPLAILCCSTPCDRPKYNDIKDHVLKCWMVARLCQPDYVLSRSRLCSTVWPTVTTCFVLYILNIIINILDWIFIDNDPLNSVTKGTLVQLVITGQIVIVVIGWIVLLVRWVTSDGQGNISGEYDFSELEARFIGFIGFIGFSDKRILLKISRDMNKKIRDIQSKFWYAWRWVQTHFQNFPMQDTIPVVDQSQFPRYNETLSMLPIPGESGQSLWKANQRGFRKVETYMDHDDGKRSPSELICLLMLKTVTAAGEAGISANKKSWKMTAVSLIHLMLGFYNGHQNDSDIIKNAMQCYSQGWEYMDFVDGLDEEVKSLGRQADGEFDRLEHSWKKRAEPEMPLRQLRVQLESLLNEVLRDLQNSRDSTEVAKYLFETWTVIDPHLPASPINKIVWLQRVLANVYFLCMTEGVNKAVLQKCRKLAEEGMEEEIVDAAILLAKAEGVLHKYKLINLRNRQNPVENPHNTGQTSTSSTIPTEIEEDAGEHDSTDSDKKDDSTDNGHNGLNGPRQGENPLLTPINTARKL